MLRLEGIEGYVAIEGADARRLQLDAVPLNLGWKVRDL